MEASKEIIQQAKDRFKELKHKDFEWRSFYNGYLEAKSQQLDLNGIEKCLPKQRKKNKREREMLRGNIPS